MKKLIVALLAMVTGISLVACGSKNTSDQGNTNVDVEADESAEDVSEEENQIIREYVEEVEEEVVVELTAEEKYEKAKLYMRDGDLEDALALLQEIETELPEAAEWIPVCEEYIPLSGIWLSNDYVSYDKAKPNEKDGPSKKARCLRFYIDCNTSKISVDFLKTALNEDTHHGTEIGFAGEDSGYEIKKQTIERTEIHESMEYKNVKTFNFATGEYKEVTERKGKDDPYRGTTIRTGTFKKYKDIKDYRTVDSTGALGIPLTNPCELLENCWLTSYNDNKDYIGVSYRLSDHNASWAKEKYDQYIPNVLDWLEIINYQYKQEPSGLLKIWTSYQNMTDDEPCMTITLDKMRLEIKKQKKVEVTADKPPAPVDPAIGMTSQQVLRSTWGRPKKKNITEYTFGIHEQWVYDRGYIYIEDGVVTAIQHN